MPTLFASGRRPMRMRTTTHAPASPNELIVHGRPVADRPSAAAHGVWMRRRDDPNP